MILVVFLAGGSLSVLLLNDTADFFQNLKEQRRLRDEKKVAEAQQSLLQYMLLRSQYPYDIARPIGSPIHPRLLMLPCPDNVGDVGAGSGDKNLDGTQDATCAAKPPSSGNIVNDILGSGSRFGRLPWKLGTALGTGNEINDGLGEDFRDSHGNRLWYALSKNLAPQSKHTEPFNLHRLTALDDGWLSVVDIPEGGTTEAFTLSHRVAAVVLSPGKHKSARLNERTLAAKVFSSHKDIDPKLYFESVTTHVGGTKIYANNNKDGVFVQLRKDQRGDFDDTLAYITLDEVMNADGHFLLLYKKLAGINNVQNQPFPYSPLAKMASVFSAYYDFFEFYPTPAAQTLSANITTVFRHCAAYHSGAKALSAVVNPGAVFLLPNTIAAANLSATISLTAESELLAAENLTLSLIDPPPTVSISITVFSGITSTVAITTTLYNTVVTEDSTIRASSTAIIARYARLRLPSGTLLSGGVIPSPGDRVTLAATTTVRFVAKTPFAPAGDLAGWFPEHYKTTMKAGNDNSKFIIQAGVRAGFLLSTPLSANITVTLSAKDHISLTAGATIHLEKDLKTLSGSVSVIVSINGVAHFADGTTITLVGYKPSPGSFEQRQYVVFLLADAVKGSKTITAPAVLYPWRKESGSSTDTRDNLHPYPPCLDTRNFFDASFRAFVQDQPTYYAVAAECHYGGNSQCGNMTVGGGLTVSVGVGGNRRLAGTFNRNANLCRYDS